MRQIKVLPAHFGRFKIREPRIVSAYIHIYIYIYIYNAFSIIVCITNLKFGSMRRRGCTRRGARCARNCSLTVHNLLAHGRTPCVCCCSIPALFACCCSVFLFCNLFSGRSPAPPAAQICVSGYHGFAKHDCSMREQSSE